MPAFRKRNILSRHHSGRGFTLIEALISVAIIGIIFTVGPSIFIQVNRFVVLNKARIELQREARTALSLMNRNLRQAQVNTIVLDQAANQPYYSRITFTRSDGVTFCFYQQGTSLMMSTSNTTQELSENLRYLAFVPQSTEDLSIISVSLTMEKSIYEAKTKALHMASEKVMVMN